MKNRYNQILLNILAIGLVSTVRGFQRPKPICTDAHCPSPSGSLPPPSPHPSPSHKSPLLLIINTPIADASRAHKPSPTPGMMPHHNRSAASPREFFERFYRLSERLKNLMKEGKPLSSIILNQSPHPRPTPTMESNQLDDDLKRRLRKVTDELMALISEDSGGQERRGPATMHIKPTPSPTGMPTNNDREAREREKFNNVILQGFKDDKDFLEKIVASGRIDLRNGSAVRNYVHSNLPRIASGYWKFLRWVERQLQAMPCDRDCDHIERMVEFCKMQHKHCQKPNPMPSPMPSILPMKLSLAPSPFLHMSDDDRPCSAGTKRCPFKSGCFPGNSSCLSNMDIFKDMGQFHSRVVPRPTPSINGPLDASRYPSSPPIIRRSFNQSMLEYAWREAAKLDAALKLDDLRRTFEIFSRGDRDERTDRDREREGICSQRCQRQNTTFCWAEMSCKRTGAKCSLKHLRDMMNRTVFENQEKCTDSFYCPIVQNCTSDRESCNTSRFMVLPCDKECMQATNGRGKRPSPEEVQIFRLKCKDGEKFCPSSTGCVDMKESCIGNKRLGIPLGNGIENERRALCRMRDFICPRVYSAWVKMRAKCPKRSANFTKEGIPFTKRPDVFPGSLPPPNMSLPPKPQPSATKSRETIHHSRSPTQPSTPSLPSFTLKINTPLSMQIILNQRVQFIAVTQIDCPKAIEFHVIRQWSGSEKVNIPAAGSGRGAVLPLNIVLKFVPIVQEFHGLCLLKYTLPASGVRYDPGQLVNVAPDAAAGTLAVVIFPNVGKVEAKLIGRNFIEIREDEINPPCFKLSDMIQFNMTATATVSGIKPEFENRINKAVLAEYLARLNEIRTGTIRAAVLASPGVSWTSGVWKARQDGSSFRKFPMYFSKFKPFTVGIETCVAFYPAKNFDGKVRLLVAGALFVTEKGILRSIIGNNIVQVGVDVMPEPDAPELSTKDSCLPSFPFGFNDAVNTGFKIENLLKSGKAPCGNSKLRQSPLLENIKAFKGKGIGLAITQVSRCEEFGHWESKDADVFRRIEIGGGMGRCLFETAHIRFVPKNYTELWSVPQAQRCIWIKARAWLPLSANATGPCNITNNARSLFSSSEVQLSALRKGCDDIIGSMRKPDSCGRCGKKRLSNVECPCDGVPGSGAIKDECGRCSGGTTGKVYQKRDCNKKCYENGTLSENVEDSCGRCQNRRFVNKQAQDCNGDCSFGKQRACRNKCGICVGGRTRRPLNDGINACGVCIANSSAPCVKSLSLDKPVEVSPDQQFFLKIKARGYSSLNSLSCSLQKAGGSASPIILGRMYAYGLAKAIKSSDPDACELPDIGDYEMKINAALKEGGEYSLSCKVDRESSATVVAQGIIKVISSKSSVQEIVPPTIDSCSNGTFILRGSGFPNSSDAVCGASCQERCDFNLKGRFINQTAFECNIEVPEHKKECEAQEINLHVLASSAVRPPSFSGSAAKAVVQCAYPEPVSGQFMRRFRVLAIKLNKPASFFAVNKRQRPDCASFFDAATARALGNSRCHLSFASIIIMLSVDSSLISSAVGSRVSLRFNREHLRCRGRNQLSVLRGNKMQELNVSLPLASVEAAISGAPSVGTCDKLRLSGIASSGAAGGKLTYNWELIKDSAVVESENRRSWFKIDGRSLTPNGNYKVKLCVSNSFGQNNCKESRLAVVDNSNRTMIVKMNGALHRRIKARGKYRFRPYAKISQCGGRAKKAKQMLFTWQVKDKDGLILKSSEGRTLRIEKGDLTPSKNYTLKCFVRARLESGEEVTGDTEMTVEVEGSPVKAKIRGGRKMTVGCNQKAVLDARTSEDPDKTDERAQFSWSCNDENGFPCFNKSNPLQRLSFQEADKVSFDADDVLECNKSYVFNLDYRKGERRSNASVTVSLKPGEPAEVKLEQRRTEKRIIVMGYIKTKSSANISWSCIEKEGYGRIDMSDKDVVTEVLPGPILVRQGNNAVARRKILIISTEALVQGESYLLSLEAENADEKSNAQIVITTPSPPAEGEITVEPSEGVALNTTFVISAGEGWVGDGLKYEFGYEVKTSKGIREVAIKAFSEESFLDGIKLPPGDKRANHTLKLYVKAQNLDGLVTKAIKTVKIREREEISEGDLKEMASLSEQAIKEKNYEEAFRTILAITETSKSASINQTGETSVNEDLTVQVLSVADAADVSAETIKSVLNSLELTTEPREGIIDIQGATREKVASVISGLYTTVSDSSEVVSKRKRRSIENSGSQETFQPKSKEEVDSTMATFDNVIDEQQLGSVQDNLKMNFTNTVPSLLRSLCASTITVNDYLISKSNLTTLRSNRLPGYTFNSKSVNMSDNSNGSVILGSYLKQKYETWNCTNSGLLCTEVCVGTVLHHHHLFTGEFQDRISDIASTILLHPETHAIEDPGVLATPLTYTLLLKEVPDAQHKVECRVWNSVGSNWTKEGCNTSYTNGQYANCQCSTLGNVTIFKVALPVITTLFPPTTTPESSSTTRQSSQTNVATNQSNVTPTQSTKVSTAKLSDSQPSTQISFSFPDNYNDFANKETDLKNAIINMLSSKLNISKNRILNLNIRPGSIIVTFTLLNNSGYGNERNVDDLKTMLTSLAKNGSLTLVFNGVTLKADAASLKFSQPPLPTKQPPPKPAKSSNVVIIVSVCVAFVIVIALVIAVWWFAFKKKREKGFKSNNLTGSTMLFGDDIKLQDRASTSPDYGGFNNQRFVDSPEQQKIPLKDPGEVETDRPVRRVITPVGHKPDSAAKLGGDSPGGVVSVGIGSSTSLKKDLFAS